MRIMKELGFDVPENGLVSFAGEQNHKEFAFVIKRFDRDEQQTEIHQEQLDGAMNIQRQVRKKIGADNEQYVSYEQIAKFILQHTENHLAQQREIFSSNYLRLFIRK